MRHHIRPAIWFAFWVCLAPAAYAESEYLLPHIANGQYPGGSIRTSFILFNHEAGPVSATIELRDGAGQPLKLTLPGLGTGDQFSTTLESGETRILQSSADGALVAGSARVVASAGLGISAVFSVFDGQGMLVTEAGVAPSTPASEIVIPVIAGGFLSTGLALANPSELEVKVSLRLLDSEGQQSAATTRTLPPRGHLARFVTELFEGLSQWQGTLSVSCPSPIAALTLRQNSAPLAFTTLPVALADSGGRQFNLAHIGNGADGGLEFRTTFVAFNLSKVPSDIRLDLTKGDNGEDFPLVIPELDEEASSVFEFGLGPGAAKFLETNGAGPLTAGAARITSTAGIAVSAIFSVYDAQGGLVTTAGVGHSRPLFESVIPVDTAGSFDTGVALMNPGDGGVAVSLKLRDESGQPQDSASLTLDGEGHRARFVSQLFPQIGDFRGSLLIEAPTAVAALGLRQNFPPLNFTSLPVAVSHGPSATLVWDAPEASNDTQVLLTANYTQAEPSSFSVRQGDFYITRQFTVGTDQAVGLASFSDGSHSITATIENQSGESVSASTTLLVDTRAPTLDIDVSSSPPEWTVEVSYSDANLDASTLEVLLNGQQPDGVDVGPEAAVFSGALGPGTYSIEASVGDLAGNATSATMTFTVDYTPPGVTLSIPDGGIANTPTPTFTIGYADDAALDLDSLKVTIDGADQAALFSLQGTEATYTVPSGLPLAEGPHSITAAIADLGGNEASATASFLIDTLAPLVTVRPAPGSTVSRAPELRFDYRDPGDFASGIDLSALLITVNDVDRSADFEVQAGRASLQLLPSLELLPAGSNTIRAVVADLAGNTQEMESTFQVTPQPAGNPPVVAIASPASSFLSAYNGTPLEVVAAVEPPQAALVRLLADGNQVGESIEPPHHFEFVLPDDGLPAQVLLTVEATDSSGTIILSSPLFVSRNPLPAQGPIRLEISGPAATVAGEPLAVTIRGLDADGSEVELDTGSLFLASSDPASSIGGLSLPVDQNSQGQIELPPLLTVGLRSIEATWSGDFLVRGSAQVAVSPAAPLEARIEDASPEQIPEAGQRVVFRTSVVDAFDNPIPDLEAVVTVTQIDAQGSQAATTHEFATSDFDLVPVQLNESAAQLELQLELPDVPGLTAQAAFAVKDDILVNIFFEERIVQAGVPTAMTVSITDRIGILQPLYEGTVYIYSWRFDDDPVSLPGGAELGFPIAVEFAKSDRGERHLEDAVAFQVAGGRVVLGSTLQLPDRVLGDVRKANGISSFITVLPSFDAVQLPGADQISIDLENRWPRVEVQVHDALGHLGNGEKIGNGLLDVPLMVQATTSAGSLTASTRSDHLGNINLSLPLLEDSSGSIEVNVFEPGGDPANPLAQVSESYDLGTPPPGIAVGLEPLGTGEVPTLQLGSVEAVRPYQAILLDHQASGCNGEYQAQLDFWLSATGETSPLVLGAPLEELVSIASVPADAAQSLTIEPDPSFPPPPPVPGSPPPPLPPAPGQASFTVAFEVQEQFQQLPRVKATLTATGLLDPMGQPACGPALISGAVAVNALTVGLADNKAVFEVLDNFELAVGANSGGLTVARLEGARTPLFTPVIEAQEFLQEQQVLGTSFYSRPFRVQIGKEASAPGGGTVIVESQECTPPGPGASAPNCQTPLVDDPQNPGQQIPDPERILELSLHQVHDRLLVTDPVVTVDRLSNLYRPHRVASGPLTVTVEGPARGDGTAEAVVRITVRDAEGGSIEGAITLLSSSAPDVTIAAQPLATDRNGRAKGSVRCGGSGSRAVEVSVQLPDSTTQTASARVLFYPGTLHLIPLSPAGRLRISSPPELFLQPGSPHTAETFLAPASFSIEIVSQVSDEIEFRGGSNPMVTSGQIPGFSAGFAPRAVRFHFPDIEPFWFDFNGDGSPALAEIGLQGVAVDDGLHDTAAFPVFPSSFPEREHFAPLTDPVFDPQSNFSFLPASQAEGAVVWDLYSQGQQLSPRQAQHVQFFSPGPNRILAFAKLRGDPFVMVAKSRFLLSKGERVNLGTFVQSSDGLVAGLFPDRSAYPNHFLLRLPLDASGEPPGEEAVGELLGLFDLVPLGGILPDGLLVVDFASRELTPQEMEAQKQNIEAYLASIGPGSSLFYPKLHQLVRTPINARTITDPETEFDLNSPSLPESPRGTTPFGGGDDTVNLHNGEFVLTEEDLRISQRGLDWAHIRTYRSHIDYDGPQGQSWDFNYNMHVGELPLLQRTAGPGQQELRGDVVLYTGTGRRELFRWDADSGRYLSPPGIYLELLRFKQPDDKFDRFELRDPQGNVFTFRFIETQKIRLDRDVQYFRNILREGQSFRVMASLTAIRDRQRDSAGNPTNLMTFSYDTEPEGQTLNPSEFSRLTEVTTTTGKTILYRYSDDGTLKEIEDFTGRKIGYEYHTAQDQSLGRGTPRDLKQVVSPAVVGTSNGNDFPQGKSRTYTYLVAQQGSPLRHNLRSLTSGRGNIGALDLDGDNAILVNQYGVAPNSIEFDRVVSQQFGKEGEDTFGTFEFAYSEQEPATVERDRKGFFDIWRFQGNAIVDYRVTVDPDSQLWRAQGRKATPLELKESEDAEGGGAIVTLYEHNLDGELTKVTFPLGNSVQYIFEPDDRPAGNGLSRGNLKRMIVVPRSTGAPGEFPHFTDYEYRQPFNLVEKVTSPRAFRVAQAHREAYQTILDYDADGNVIETRNRVALGGADGQTITTSMTYNDFGQLLTQTNPNDSTDVYEYDEEAGYLESLTLDSQGTQLKAVYQTDSVGNVITLINPRGVESSYEFNALNQVVRIVRATQSTQSDGPPPLPVTLRFFYDEDDNLVRRELSNSPPSLPPGYDANELPSTIVFEWKHDSLGHVTSESVNGETTAFGYDANGNQVSVQPPLPTTAPTNTTFDFRDLPVSFARDSLVRTLEYDSNRKSVKSTDSNGNVVLCVYDGHDRQSLVTRVSSSGPPTVSRVLYDATGNPRQHDVVGNDGEGNNRLLSRRVTFYDSVGRAYGMATAYFSERGSPGHSSFDDLRGDADDFVMVEQSVPAIAPLRGWVISSVKLDELGNVEVAVDDSGVSTDFGYDTAGRLVEITDALQNKVEWMLDSNGNVIRSRLIDVSGLPSPEVSAETSTVYDALDREIQITDLAGHAVEYVYDNRGEILSELDANGHRVNLYHDPQGRQVRTQRIASGDGLPPNLSEVNVRTVYDANSRRVSEVDANGNATVYQFNHLDRLVSTTFPDGTAETFINDANGNIVGLTDQRGFQLEMMYDEADRLTLLSHLNPDLEDGTTQRVYSWDGLDRPVSVTENQIIAGQSHQRVVRMHFDSMGRAVREIQQRIPASEGDLSQVEIHTKFNGTGDVLESSYPSPTGTTIVREYDLLHRLEKIREMIASGPTSIASYSYLGASRLNVRSVGIAAELQKVHQYRPDEPALLDTLKFTSSKGLLLELSQLYDPGHRTTNRKVAGFNLGQINLEDAALHFNEAFSYNSLDQLVSVDRLSLFPTIWGFQGELLKTQNSYDATGNLLDRQRQSIQILPVSGQSGRRPYRIEDSFTIDALHRYQSFETQVFDTSAEPDSLVSQDLRSFGYDANGNLTSTPLFDIKYDVFNRPILVSIKRLRGGLRVQGDELLNGQAVLNLIDVDARVDDGVFQGGTLFLDYRGNGQVHRGAYQIVQQDAGEFWVPEEPGSELLEKVYGVRYRVLLGAGQPIPFTQSPGAQNWSPMYLAERPKDAQGNVQPLQIARYLYDGLNRRTDKWVTNRDRLNEHHLFVFDGMRLLSDARLSANRYNQYLYGSGPNELVRLQHYGDVQGKLADFVFYFMDGLEGTTQRLVDFFGNVVEAPLTDATGRIPTIGPVSERMLQASHHALTWQGLYLDFETGLYNVMHRYLHPALGRFTSADPLGAFFEPTALGNPYTYAGNQPISRRDSLGLQSDEDTRRMPTISRYEPPWLGLRLWRYFKGFFFGVEDSLEAAEAAQVAQDIKEGLSDVVMQVPLIFDDIAYGFGANKLFEEHSVFVQRGVERGLEGDSLGTIFLKTMGDMHVAYWLGRFAPGRAALGGYSTGTLVRGIAEGDWKAVGGAIPGVLMLSSLSRSPQPPKITKWNQFQAATRGQFRTRAEAGRAWTAYKAQHGIRTGRKPARRPRGSERHHTVTREVLRNRELLQPKVANHPLVRGRSGAPNIWRIPAQLHRRIHSGPRYGGWYNRAWRARLNRLKGKATPLDVLAFRYRLVRRWGLERYR